MRLQPPELLHVLRRRIGQQHGDVIFEAIHLDNARDVDIARAAVFAASDMAGFITGSTIHVDGGVDAS